MLARVSRPLYTTISTTRLLSSRSIHVNRDSVFLVSRNKVIKATRRVSTSPFPSETNAPGIPRPSLSASGSFVDVKIPPTEMDPEPPIQVPYVPDFWDSAKPIPDTLITEVPKVVVVGGTETSHGSARPHTLEDINVPLESDSSQLSQGTQRSDSFLDDIAEDLHFPPIQEIKYSLRKIFS